MLITAKDRKQPACAPTNNWIEKTWCIHTREYYPALKNNELLIPIHATARTSLECMLGERTTSVLIPLIWIAQMGKSTEPGRRPVVARGWEWAGNWGFLGVGLRRV